MQKALGLGLCSLFIFLISCSTEINDPGINNSFSVLGYWVALEVDYSGSSTVTTAGQSDEFQLNGQLLSTDLNVAFMQTPNQFVSNGQITIELTTSGNGHTSTEVVPDLEIFQTRGTWSRNDNIISVSSSDTLKEYTIEELRPNRLVLVHNGTKSVTDQETNATTQINTETRIVFGK